MKKSRLLGTRLVENIRVPHIPNVIMLDSSDDINKIRVEEGDLLDTYSIRNVITRQVSNFVTNDILNQYMTDNVLNKYISNNIINRYYTQFQNLPSMCKYGENHSYGNKLLQFIHISDNHGDFESVNRAIQMSQYQTIDCIVHTGDWTKNDSNDTPNPIAAYKSMVESTTKPFYYCIGNHDVVGNISSNYLSESQLFTAFIQPIIDKGYLVAGEYTQGKCRYYHDVVDKKVRMIFLYDYDNPNQYQRAWQKYSQDQLDWFINILKNTPDGYSFIIFKHHPFSNYEYVDFVNNSFCVDQTDFDASCSINKNFYGYVGYPVDEDFLAPIVDAYINKKSINYTANRTTQSVDFTTVTNTTYFGGFFGGHLHADVFLRHKTLTDIFGYDTQCLNTVDPNITGSQDIRITNDGSVGSDCVTVVSVDALHKKLGLAKIGDTITVHGRKRDYAVINTSNSDYTEYNGITYDVSWLFGTDGDFITTTTADKYNELKTAIENKHIIYYKTADTGTVTLRAYTDELGNILLEKVISSTIGNIGYVEITRIDITSDKYKVSHKDFVIYQNDVSGTTAERPSSVFKVGYQYFDTTLKKPIWYSGKGWVDSTGTAV